MLAAFGVKLGRKSRSESIWGICADRHAFLAVEQTCARHLQPSQLSKQENFRTELNINVIEVMPNQTAKVFQAWQIRMYYVAPKLHFMCIVDFAVETVRMTDALLQQLFYQEVAAQHQIAETFRIIQSHGEQVG